MQIKSEEQAQRLAGELKRLRELEANPKWVEFMGLLEAAEKEQLQGCTAKGKSPAERSEYIEGYHLAERLLGWLPGQVEEIERALLEWERGRVREF